MTTEEYLRARKRKDWNFNRIVPEESFNQVSRIHPLKQRQVADVVAAARDDDYVRRIIIFGSASRYDCDITSDLDICIDWNEDCYDAEGVLKPFTGHMRKCISDITQGDADVVNFQYLDSTDIKDSVEEGVVVYEQHHV